MPSDRPNKPHGRFTPASTVGRLLTAAGYGAAFIRKGFQYGGHSCSWDELTKRTWIRYRCPDDLPDSMMEAERKEMLDLYKELLLNKDYTVEATDRMLYVWKETRT